MNTCNNCKTQFQGNFCPVCGTKYQLIEKKKNKGKVCLICGKSLGAFTAKVPIEDGEVCADCWVKAGCDLSYNSVMTAKQYTSEMLKDKIAAKKTALASIEDFKPTKKIGDLAFDDNTQTFIVKVGMNKNLYRYNQIVDFELLEDGNSITKGGLGRAAVGGLLFGGVGAIVGGVTGKKKTKSVCTSLKIKITLRNSPKQTEYVNFIATATKTDGFVYKASYQLAQESLSALQLAVDKVNTSVSSPESKQVETQPVQAVSSADEILKYKGLLDAGIITEEEFKAKKAQLLGL